MRHFFPLAEHRFPSSVTGDAVPRPPSDTHSTPSGVADGNVDALELVSPSTGGVESSSRPGGVQDSWSINRETVARHHKVPQTTAYAPDENTFPILFKKHRRQ